MTWEHEIEFDADGYPEEDGLEALRSYPIDFHSAARFIIEFLGSGDFHYARRSEVSDAVDGFTQAPIKVVNFSTGGWSGNEDLIGTALRRFDVAHFLKQWNAGGHYQFQVPVQFLDKEAGQ